MKGACLRCGKNYQRLDHHLKSKRPCKIIYLDIPRDIMVKKYDEYYDVYVLKKSTLKINDKIVKVKCDQCGNEYSHNSSLSRHKKIHINQTNITNNITNNTTNNNTTNNTTNINSNNTINNHIHIHVNNFGEEKEIDYKKIVELFNGNVSNLIPGYVKEKHIEMEENRNIWIPNHKDTLIKILTDEGWVLAHKTSILKGILRTSVDNLIKQISKAGNIYQKKYKGDEPIEKTGAFKRIVQIQDSLFNIEDNMNSKNACKDEELKILCELVNGQEKVIETMKMIEEHIKD